MKTLLTVTAALSLLCLGVASADIKPSVSSELNGIENVLSVIGNVNLRKTDPKAAQSIMDILEAKNQMYTSSTASKKLQAKAPGALATQKIAPPSRGQKSF
jgi:hypothetical protein